VPGVRRWPGTRTPGAAALRRGDYLVPPRAQRSFPLLPGPGQRLD